MKSIDLIITPRDPLILRDGRPFGEAGVPQTGSLNWPRPGTVIGMIRCVIGNMREPDYFESGDENRLSEIRKVALAGYLPVQKNGDGRYSPLLPAPADAVGYLLNENEEDIELKAISPKKIDKNQGTDIPWENWQYPEIDDPRKPSKNAPLFWKWPHYSRWLAEGRLSKPMPPLELGALAPEVETRTHVAISADTGTAVESQLFTTLGVRFRDEIAIAARITTPEEDIFPKNDVASLGGDRRPSYLEWGDRLVNWPAPVEGIGVGKGLRLFLITPGLFDGGWAPQWLLQSLETNDFVKVPGVEVNIRLCSACVPRWTPCHGWDMASGSGGAPKPMRKMAPAGAVYFVETDSDNLEAAVKELWNISLCENEQDRRDGFGRIIVGNWL